MSADLQRIIRIVFQGDNQTIRAFNELNRDLNTMESMVRGVTGPLSDLADKTLKAQAAMAALATAGIALAVKEAGNWSDSFNEISTLLDITGDDLDNFRRQVLDYGKDSAFAFDDVNASVYAAISAGREYSESLDFIRQAEQLAIAGKADLEATTIALVSVMNAYGASAEEAGRYSDVLFTTVREGQTTLPEMAQYLSQVTSLAAAGGVPIETLAAAIATLTSKGMPTAEAMTALRGAIQAIISPSQQAAKYAEELGIEFNAGALASKGLEGVLLDVWEATDGNVEAVAQLFGNVRGLTGVLATFGQDGGQSFLDNQRAMRESSGATAEAYEKMKDNISRINSDLIKSMQAAFVEAGLPILKDYGDAVRGLTSIFDGLSIGIAEGAFEPLFTVLEGTLQGFTKWAERVGEILPEALEGIDYTRLIKGLDDLGMELQGVISAIFQGLDPTKPEELQEIIQTLVDALGGLSTTASAIIKEWKPVFELIGSAIQSFANADEKSLKFAGSLLGLAQKAEAFYNTFGFFKGSLVMAAGEFSSTEESVSRLGQAFVVLKGVLVAIIAKKAVGAVVGAITGIRAATALAVGAAGAQTGLLGMAAVAGSIATAGGLIALVGALGGIAHAANEAGRKISGYFSDAGAEAEASARRIGLVEDEISKIKALTDELIEFNMSIKPPEPFTREEVDWIAEETRRQMEAAGLGHIDVDFSVMRDGAESDLDAIADKVDETKKEIEEPVEVPIEMQVAELEAQSREVIAQIEATSAIIQENIRWTAELNIAEVQANAQIMEAMFASIDNTITSTGETLLGLFGMLDGSGALGDRSRIRTQIADESRMRDEAHSKQMQMLDAQLRLMDERARAMARGDAMIQIDGQGLQPHLEAFMWEVLAAIQIRVNEEGMDMLLGQS